MDLFDNYIKNVDHPADKNDTFPLIGICVSYNYYDTLQFFLPVNHMHFEKLFIITQKDDEKTINLCKKFKSVKVLFYNFNKNNKVFDKYGAINHAQKIVYKKYPNHWYINIDSDILLPNNFVDLLKNKNLCEDYIYGILRTGVLKTSQLMNKNDELEKYKLYIKEKQIDLNSFRKSVIGYFQLYKKQIYQGVDYINAAKGDIQFSRKFDNYLYLNDIQCFHLGPTGKNWSGKTDDFIDDVNICEKELFFNVERLK
jgi:hypothetical protein